MNEEQIKEKIAQLEKRLKEIRRPKNRAEVSEKDMILESLEYLRSQLPRSKVAIEPGFYSC